jgi:hypothetical protein
MLQFLPINATGSGANVIIPGSNWPNRRIMVLNYCLVADTDVTIKWQSVGATTTDLSGELPLVSNGGIATSSSMSFGSNPIGLFQTKNGGDNLVLNLSLGAGVGGHICFFVLNG